MSKILITGGAGFVGFHLAKRLSSRGHDVVLADNFFRSERDEDLINLLKTPNVTLVEVDLTQKESWEKVGEGYDYVYHLVGINGTKLFYEIPYEVLRIGLFTTLNVLEWFRISNNNPKAKILYTSSNEVYAGTREAFGDSALPIPTSETVPEVIPDIFNPRWSYAGQKLIGEQLFIHASKAYEFRMAIVRPHNFYGPREGHHHVIPEFIERVKERTDPFILLGSQEKRSYCYIEDAVEAMQMVMESEKTDGELYHIGSHEEAKPTYLAKKIFEVMKWEPAKLDFEESLKGSVNRRVPDISKIFEATGWEPKTSLSKGIEKTVDWYVRHPRPTGKK